MSVRNLTSGTSEASGQGSSSSPPDGDMERSRNGRSSSDVKNPFSDYSAAEEEDEPRVYTSQSGSDASLIEHAQDKSGEIAAGAAISDYKGYYSRNGGARRGSRQGHLRVPAALPSSSTLSSNAGISNNDIMSPPAFDRYPLVGSRVASMAAVNPHIQGASGTSGTPVGASTAADQDRSALPHNNSSSSISSSNPFLSDQDFSPFGGYPATSFPLLMDEKEDDDYLHNPDPEEEARLDRKRFALDFKHMDKRSIGGLLGFLLLFLGGVAVFVVLPVITYTGATDHGRASVVPLLTLYQYPQLSAIRTKLVDPDTPSNAQTRVARDGSKWPLVFSDEFNAEGRTFYEGDDQFWTAVDINYASTNDLEWYTPDAVTTTEGAARLRMDAYKNHDLFYRSGMLQSWNKMCFTQGILEISANLPNYGRVTGLWPGMWTLGNLGRPGYRASTEGVWPYSYEACDAGITPNQSSSDGISYLPGQKLSICTCDGEDHPNQGVGRGASEIDVIEAEADTKLGVGLASQSLQIAPFDIWYIPDYEFLEIHNQSTTVVNTYCGGPIQQAVSAVTTLNTTWYEYGPDAGYFQKYSFEYLNDRDTGYIQWYVGDNPTFTINAMALHPNGNVDWRYISREPMSVVMNLGLSNSWAYIDWAAIYFPVTMSIDYVRVYQPSNNQSITCDPENYPTYDYIQKHLNAYQDANLTSWEEAGYTFPKNVLTGNCKSSKFSF
ncbi:LAMI_0F11562g1_1 [Lachancea mirantina]|uniref:LAMI_0F11562g1_1 n=1 Tax=Lachancea mirantina TaxID=1230905 RepID=A0A1G4K2L0_9SACH|nr:LAMI_0F11562g1_1 [Lachancea mirantina]